VGHVDRRGAEPALQELDLGPHLDAQLGVEVRQGLVEEEHLRVAHQGAPDGHALALAARQVPRLAVEIRVEAQQARGLIHPLGNGGAVHAVDAHSVADVVAHAHMGVERVVLEHHGGVALARPGMGHVAPGDGDAPRCHRLEPRKHPQRGSLSAARGPDKDEELALPDRQVDLGDDGRRPEGLGDPFHLHMRHGVSPQGKPRAGRAGPGRACPARDHWAGGSPTEAR
jgi:hypothetical protein